MSENLEENIERTTESDSESDSDIIQNTYCGDCKVDDFNAKFLESGLIIKVM